jgi:hypothetical protein
MYNAASAKEKLRKSVIKMQQGAGLAVSLYRSLRSIAVN